MRRPLATRLLFALLGFSLVVWAIAPIKADEGYCPLSGPTWAAEVQCSQENCDPTCSSLQPPGSCTAAASGHEQQSSPYGCWCKCTGTLPDR